jgi:hypothetical protein
VDQKAIFLCKLDVKLANMFGGLFAADRSKWGCDSMIIQLQNTITHIIAAHHPSTC